MSEPEPYSRQTLLPEIGIAGQKQLLASSVAVVGCGALGTLIARGRPKAVAAAGKLRQVNSQVEVEPVAADANPDNVERLLNDEGIAERSGGRCGYPLTHRLAAEGAVRGSFYFYNTEEEVTYFLKALEDIIQPRLL